MTVVPVFLAFLFVMGWFSFLTRPVPKYVYDLRDAVLSGRTYEGELIYFDAPRTPSQHPACYHNRLGLLSPGYRAVYRYDDGSGEAKYATAYFDYGSMPQAPARVSLGAHPSGRVFVLNGNMSVRKYGGVRYYLYYMLPFVLSAGFLAVFPLLFP